MCQAHIFENTLKSQSHNRRNENVSALQGKDLILPYHKVLHFTIHTNSEKIEKKLGRLANALWNLYDSYVDIHVLLQKHKQEHNGTDQNDPE